MRPYAAVLAAPPAAWPGFANLPWVAFVGLPALAAPCLYLAWQRGGASAETQSWTFVWIFLALATSAVAHVRARAPIRVPWTALLLLSWPLVQLAPLPPSLLERLAPERARELAEFAAAGLHVTPTISLYPYATARMFLILAAGIALYWLARDLVRRAPAALAWLAIALVVSALAEALPALRQFLAQPAGPGDSVRGTFGNRNLLACWLEGCYGVSLGLFTARLASHAPGRLGLLALAAIPPAILAMAVVSTYSRMGIVSLAAVTVAVGIYELRVDRSRAAALAALALVVALGAAAAGLVGLPARFRWDTLAEERQGRLAMWSDSVATARRYFPGGAGAGAFQQAFRRSHPYLMSNTIDHPHNEYLETAVEWGPPAAILIALGVTAAMWRCARGLRGAQPESRRLGVGCLAGAAAVLLHAAADFPLRLPAILTLFSVLLGMATGAAPLAGPAPRAGGRLSAWALMFVALGLAALSLWSAPPADGAPLRLERWNAEAHFRAARVVAAESTSADNDAAYRRVLEANPYAAPAWNELALAAEARGDRGLALRLGAMAATIEPHTRRGEWTEGNLRLRLGDVDGAVAKLAPLARHHPETRAALWDAAWRAGLDPARILEALVPADAEAFDQYWQYLVDRGRHQTLVDACAARSRSLDPRTLRLIFDRFFQDGASAEAIRLWRLRGGPDGFANGDLAREPVGYGFDWVISPLDGVEVERRADAGGFRLDIRFLRAVNVSYDGVRHDFAVTPGRDYRLRLEARAESITSSSGPQVAVVSARRLLAVSEPLSRTTGWRGIELRFRPALGERLCRLKVIRQPASSFDNRVTGRFSLRQVSLVP